MIGDERKCEECGASFISRDDCHWFCDVCTDRAMAMNDGTQDIVEE